jgi:hypothetical protein
MIQIQISVLVFFRLMQLQSCSLIQYFLFCLHLGLTESIYVTHKDEYTEFEQASLGQLYQSKVILLDL